MKISSAGSFQRESVSHRATARRVSSSELRRYGDKIWCTRFDWRPDGILVFGQFSDQRGVVGVLCVCPCVPLEITVDLDMWHGGASSIPFRSSLKANQFGSRSQVGRIRWEGERPTVAEAVLLITSSLTRT